MSKGFKGIFISFFCLGFLILIGCSPQFTGSLTGRDGDGTGPKPSTGQATITSLSPSTVVAGASPFVLTVNGTNFTSSTNVIWDNTPLTTTYISSTVLQAQVPSSLVVNPTTITLVPSPLGTFNFGTQFTVTIPPLTGSGTYTFSKVAVAANDMVWDPVSQELYLSVNKASSNQTRANSVTAFNPQTGAFGSSAATVNEPGKLALSSDSSYLYADLLFSSLIGTSSSVQRYSLPSIQSDISIPLGSGGAPYDAIDLAVSPSNDRTVAIARGYPGTGGVGGVLIYDDATARSKSIPSNPVPINTLLWNPNGQNLYGTGNTVVGLYFMSVDSTGVQLQSQPSATTPLGSLHYDSTTQRLYSDSGSVFDAVTGALVGAFPINTLQGGLQGVGAGDPPVLVTDSKLNIAYFVGHTAFGGSQSTVLAEYDLSRFTLLGAVAVSNQTAKPIKIARWGNNGLAILTNDYLLQNVYLISGDFITSPKM
jgi:hypothetical protein